MSNDKFEVVGDLSAPGEVRNVTHIYRDYTKTGVQHDENIFLNWRVIAKALAAQWQFLAEALENLRQTCSKIIVK
jgi:hypothetical protein